jgi:hypothetical protein
MDQAIETLNGTVCQGRLSHRLSLLFASTWKVVDV